MTTNYPSATTVQFLTKLLESGRIRVEDIGQTMSQIDGVIRNLTGNEASQAAGTAPAVATPKKRGRKKGQKASPAMTSSETAAIEAAIAQVAASETPADATGEERQVTVQVIPARRGRGRPRRIDSVPAEAKPVRRAATIEEAEITESEITQDAPAPAPKLLRRAEAAAHEHHHHEEPVVSPTWFAHETEKHSGIVKWFDQRSGKGVLRVSGLSDDIVIDAAMLADSGLKRLYKDQEIEATIRRDSGRPRLVALGLPGREPAAAQALGDSAATVRRQSRPVVVEIRRDTGKQRRDRSEAERIFADKPPQQYGK